MPGTGSSRRAGLQRHAPDATCRSRSRERVDRVEHRGSRAGTPRHREAVPTGMVIVTDDDHDRAGRPGGDTGTRSGVSRSGLAMSTSSTSGGCISTAPTSRSSAVSHPSPGRRASLLEPAGPNWTATGQRTLQQALTPCQNWNFAVTCTDSYMMFPALSEPRRPVHSGPSSPVHSNDLHSYRLARIS